MLETWNVIELRDKEVDDKQIQNHDHDNNGDHDQYTKYTDVPCVGKEREKNNPYSIHPN